MFRLSTSSVRLFGTAGGAPFGLFGLRGLTSSKYTYAVKNDRLKQPKKKVTWMNLREAVKNILF